MIIGYTTGVFDLFHLGHVNMLKNAKALCDKLIVGVTTDTLSITFKNKKPMISFEERKEIVSALSYVDLAVAQTCMDKYKAWEIFKFDIMFASQNPTAKWQSVEDEFLSHFKELKQPRIIQLPYTDGVSSTSRRRVMEENND